jgi:hypothetical protein
MAVGLERPNVVEAPPGGGVREDEDCKQGDLDCAMAAWGWAQRDKTSCYSWDLVSPAYS